MILGCIADDLTGAVELASMLIAAGVPTSLTIGTRTPPPTGAVAHVVALKTRVASAEAAIADVTDAAEHLRKQSCRQMFFKYCATFDSTPAGNIGPCAEALLETLGTDFTAFCPSFCEVGRTVYQGHMFAGEQLLSESPKRCDPLTPMTDSNLVRVLARQSARRAGLIPFAAVRKGPDAIRLKIEDLRRQGVALAIVDAIDEDDLGSIAEACADLPLMTGNSSVAAHLPRAWSRRKLLEGHTNPQPLAGVSGKAAVLAGSCAERTRDQLAEFERAHPVLHLDLHRAFGNADLVAEAIAWARPRLERGPLALSTAASQERVAELQARYGRTEVAARAEQLLSEIGRQLVEELEVRRLVVCGGETSGSVLRALNVEELHVGPYEGPGVARVVAEKPLRLALLLKSGKLGPIGMLAPALDAMLMDTTHGRTSTEGA
jgi:3-dehydrotetronate 4-kinase